MTLQEAIETVENGAFWEQCVFPDDRSAVLKFHKALDIMISELQVRRGPVKLDRNRWEKCGGCEIFSRHTFCPMCGRPLTEDAWADLERRINGGKAD